MMKMNEEEILEKVRAVVEPFDCVVTGLGPDSVGVKGDARFYGPSVYVKFPKDMDWEKISEVSTSITNNVPEISRVLMDVTVGE